MNLKFYAYNENLIPSQEDRIAGSIIYTDLGNQYLVKEDLSLLKIDSLESGYLDKNDLISKNPAIVGKIYLTNNGKLFSYLGGNYLELNPSQTSETINIIDAQNNFIATTVEGALNELFQNVDNGKQVLAAAIVDKGGTASAASTFQELANAIGSMSGEVISNDYLNIVLNEEKTFAIQNINNENIVVSTFVFVPEQNSVAKVFSNLNADDVSFFEEGYIIKESGKFKNKATYEIPKKTEEVLGAMFLNEYELTGIDLIELL